MVPRYPGARWSCRSGPSLETALLDIPPTGSGCFDSSDTGLEKRDASQIQACTAISNGGAVAAVPDRIPPSGTTTGSTVRPVGVWSVSLASPQPSQVSATSGTKPGGLERDVGAS